MDNLIQADIFFFITAVAVILFASACAVLVVYLILISRDIRYVTKIVRDEADKLHGDVERLRLSLQGRSWNIFEWLPFLNIFKKKSRTKKKKVATNKES